jgi:ribonuclease HI
MTVLEELRQIQREIDSLNRRSAILLDQLSYQLSDQVLDQMPDQVSYQVPDQISGQILNRISDKTTDKQSDKTPDKSFDKSSDKSSDAQSHKPFNNPSGHQADQLQADPLSCSPVQHVSVPVIEVEESIFDFLDDDASFEKTSQNGGADSSKGGVEISRDSPISIYTDGACSGNPGPAGSGVVVIQKENIVHEISKSLGVGTNNIAELTAIKLALEFLKEHHSTQVTIYTDSTYSIGILTKNWKAKANVELVGSIQKLMKPFKRLKLTHVKGHSGHPGNERADLLAVRGSAAS